jgi:hypothetical protein
MSQLQLGGIKPADIAAAFFEELPDRVFRCRACSDNKCLKSKQGYSNLINHVLACHHNWKDQFAQAQASKGSLTSFITRKVSDRANGLFGWIQQVILLDLPVSIVDNQIFRKYSSLPKLSSKTFVKYMRLLGEKVEQRLRRQIELTAIPKKVGIIFDSWTCEQEHFTSLFVTWTTPKDYVEERMICCGVQDEPENEDDIDFSALSLGDYIFDELSLVGINLFTDVDFICGDNCATNNKLTKKISARILSDVGAAKAHIVPLIGCYSHRLNLAKKDYYEAINRRNTIAKVDNLMKQIRNLKNASKLRKKTHLKGLRKNITRWASTHNMLVRYKKLEAYLPQCNFDEDVLDMIPSVTESKMISTMIDDAKQFESVSLALQRGGNNRLDLFQARALFDRLVGNFPETANYLSSTADIIQNIAFESAVIKVLGNNNKLSREESKVLQRFRIDPIDEYEDIEESTTSDFADAVLNSAEASRRVEGTTTRLSYRSLKHVSATSNVCERLFSRAKLIARDHRKHMSPYHLELLLFLRYNHDLWDAGLIEEILCEAPANEVDNDIQIDDDEMD